MKRAQTAQRVVVDTSLVMIETASVVDGLCFDFSTVSVARNFTAELRSDR